MRRLTAGEIRRLQAGGIDVHELKGGARTGALDLFKDDDGAIYVMMKDGSGEPEPTGLNMREFRRDAP